MSADPIALTWPYARPSRQMGAWHSFSLLTSGITIIDSAGYVLPPHYSDIEWLEQKVVLQVMVLALAEICQLVLPGMLQRGYGRIVNVASMAALPPGMPAARCMGQPEHFSFSSPSRWPRQRRGPT